MDANETFYTSCDEELVESKRKGTKRRISLRLSQKNPINYNENKIFNHLMKSRLPATKVSVSKRAWFQNKGFKKMFTRRPENIDNLTETICRLRNSLKTTNIVCEKLVDWSKLNCCKIQELEFTFQRLMDSEMFQFLQDRKQNKRLNHKKKQINKKGSVAKDKTIYKCKTKKNTKQTSIDKSKLVRMLEMDLFEISMEPNQNTQRNSTQEDSSDVDVEENNNIYKLQDHNYLDTSPENSQNDKATKIPDKTIEKSDVITLSSENCNIAQTQENFQNNDARVETTVVILDASPNTVQTQNDNDFVEIVVDVLDENRNTIQKKTPDTTTAQISIQENKTDISENHVDDENNKNTQDQLDDTQIYFDNKENIDVANPSQSNCITSPDIFNNSQICSMKSVTYATPDETCSPLKTWMEKNFWSNPKAKIPVEWLKDMEDKW